MMITGGQWNRVFEAMSPIEGGVGINGMCFGQAYAYAHTCSSHMERLTSYDVNSPSRLFIFSGSKKNGIVSAAIKAVN